MNLYYKVFEQIIDKYQDDFDGIKEVLLRFYKHKNIMDNNTINDFIIDIDKAIQLEKYFVREVDVVILTLLIDQFMSELFEICVESEYYEICQNIISCSYITIEKV